MGNYNDEEILGRSNTQDKPRSSMTLLNKLVMTSVIYGVMNLITNTGSAHAQDCSQIEDFTKKLACEIEKETKELKEAKDDLADAQTDLADAQTDLADPKDEENIVTKTLKRAEKTYTDAKDTLESVTKKGKAIIQKMDDITATVKD